MSYTENFALLRYGGSAWANTENWSCGLKLRHLGGDDASAMRDECEATIDEVVDIVTTYYTTNFAHFSAGTRLNWVRLNVINKDTGDYNYPNDPLIVENLDVTGGGATGIPQVAYCVTTRGDPKRGAGAFGRWFVPMANLTPAADGRLATSVASIMADTAGTFLAALGSIDSGLGPDAWAPWHFGLSGTGSVASRTGVDSAIRQVDVGRVMDTQRRRRNQLLEAYETATTYP